MKTHGPLHKPREVIGGNDQVLEAHDRDQVMQEEGALAHVYPLAQVEGFVGLHKAVGDIVGDADHQEEEVHLVQAVCLNQGLRGKGLVTICLLQVFLLARVYPWVFAPEYVDPLPIRLIPLVDLILLIVLPLYEHPVHQQGIHRH